MKSLFLLLLLLAPGCARFTNVQVETRGEGAGTVRLESRQVITTFFDSKTSVAKLRVTNTDKSNGLSVGAITEEASATNAVDLIERIVGAAIRAAAK